MTYFALFVSVLYLSVSSDLSFSSLSLAAFSASWMISDVRLPPSCLRLSNCSRMGSMGIIELGDL